jgi:hypothetical protein
MANPDEAEEKKFNRFAVEVGRRGAKRERLRASAGDDIYLEGDPE